MADLSSETEMNSHAGDLLVCFKIYFFLAFPGNSKKTFSPFFYQERTHARTHAWGFKYCDKGLLSKRH